MRVVQAAFHYTHWPTLGMSVLAFAVMHSLRRISPKIPNVLIAVILTTAISWAAGFEHNKVVTISAIKSPEAQELIKGFNQSLTALPPLGEKRTLMNKALEEAEVAGNTIGKIDAQHDLSVIGIKIERLKHEAHQFRERIRNLIFEGIKQKDGTITFLPKEKTNSGAGADGRTWSSRLVMCRWIRTSCS